MDVDCAEYKTKWTVGGKDDYMLKNLSDHKRRFLLLLMVLLTIAFLVAVVFNFAGYKTLARTKEKKYEPILALKVDGYEKLSVEDFRKQSWKILEKNEKENMGLLDKALGDTKLYDNRFQETEAFFIRNVAVPLLGEEWTNNFVYGDIYRIFFDNYKGTANFRFIITIKDPSVTVGEYENVYRKMASSVNSLLDIKANEELENASFMKDEITNTMDKMAIEINNGEKINVKLVLCDYDIDKLNSEENMKSDNETYKNQITHDQNDETSKETKKIDGDQNIETPDQDDINKVLALRTEDYMSLSLKDFRINLMKALCNTEFIDKVDNITAIAAEYPEKLNVAEDELFFFKYTIPCTRGEDFFINIDSSRRPAFYNRVHKDYIEESESGAKFDTDLYIDYSVFYTIQDDDKFTVEEREKIITKIIKEMQKEIDRTFAEPVKNFDHCYENLQTEFNRIVERNSTTEMKLEVGYISA